MLRNCEISSVCYWDFPCLVDLAKWPLFKLLHNPFESEVPGYNGCHSYLCLKLKLFVHMSLCFQESFVICKHENSRQMENGWTDIDNYVIQNPNSFTAALFENLVNRKEAFIGWHKIRTDRKVSKFNFDAFLSPFSPVYYH